MIQFFPRLRQGLLFKYPKKIHHNPLPVSTYILVFHPRFLHGFKDRRKHLKVLESG